LSAVELHSVIPAAHEFVAGEGSFAGARAALDEADVVVTRITRSTYRELARLRPLVRGKTWILAMPDPGARFEALVPRLALAIPYALHAIRESGWLAGVPLCLVGPYASRAGGRERRYGAACEACAARSRCPGVSERYLERFGESELRPREETAPDPAIPDLAAL